MTIKDINAIMEEYIFGTELSYEDAFGAALEEIARRAGLHYTDDDILVVWLIDKVPAYADWLEQSDIDI